MASLSQNVYRRGNSQEAYAESGAFPEFLSIYHLLGDPALQIP